MAVGIAMVPEDRQHEGLILPMNVAENISLAMLNSLTKWCLISRSRESVMVDQLMNDLAVKAPSGQVPAATLSGGNQQKLVLGKWLARKFKPRFHECFLIKSISSGIRYSATI